MSTNLQAVLAETHALMVQVQEHEGWPHLQATWPSAAGLLETSCPNLHMLEIGLRLGTEDEARVLQYAVQVRHFLACLLDSVSRTWATGCNSGGNSRGHQGL